MWQLGLIDVLTPNKLCPKAITEWLARDLGPPPLSRSRVDFGGLDRIPGFLAELLDRARVAPPDGVAVPIFLKRKECETT
jgi:predicted glycosyltransferase